MRRCKTLFYNLGQGIRNIYRNRMFSLASIGTMTACLFLFGIFYFVLSNFQYMLKSAESTVGITVFFDDGLSDDEIKEVGNEILLRPEVTKVEFLSSEETWEQYKEKYLTDDLSESFGDDNPLENSASYTVYSDDVAKQSELVTYIEGLDGVRQVNNSDAIAESLNGINLAVGYVSGVIIIILLFVATFLIGTTIAMGISIRKQEISIMKLIGATDYFIRGPYIVEGVLLGLLGASIPLIFLYFTYNKMILYIGDKFTSVFSKVEFLDVDTVFSALIPISLLIGLGIGFIGSYVTLNRELRKIN